MPSLDVFKRMIARAGDAAQIWTALEGFSKTLHAPIPVAGETEAAQIASAASSESFPLYTAEGNRVFVQTSKAAERVQIAGNYPRIDFNVEATANSGGQATATIDTVNTQQGAWVISGNSMNMRVPERGFYLVSVQGSVTAQGQQGALTSDNGYAYAQIVADGRIWRNVATDTSSASATALINLAAGQSFYVQFAHNAPGAASRSFYGRVLATQVNI